MKVSCGILLINCLTRSLCLRNVKIIRLAGNGKKGAIVDCHIEPDWVLIYYVRKDDLILERTGSHSDIFKKYQ